MALGQQLDAINAWLDANCGAVNWAMIPASIGPFMGGDGQPF
jgi:hypothetical protein